MASRNFSHIFALILHQVKQIASIPFLILYLLVSIGVPVTVHYCGGEVEEVAIMQSEIHCCCEAIKENSCCGTEGHFVNLETDQHVVRIPEFTPESHMASLPALHSHEEEVVPADGQVEYLEMDHPPPQKPPLWLAHCSLTYYG